MDDKICAKSNMIDEPSSSVHSSQPNTKTPPHIHRLPLELLARIIRYLPRTQWPALELVDPEFFRNATFLAWASLREVDIDRDFIYSHSKAFTGGYAAAEEALRRDITRKTESLCKKLIDRSPHITSLIGLSFVSVDPTLNTTAIQSLSRLEYLETIKFAKDILPTAIVDDSWSINIPNGIHFVNLAELLESTQSRATLKEINIDACHIPDDAVGVEAFDRLRAAFANDSSDPSQKPLKLTSFSLGDMYHFRPPLDFLDTIDPSRMSRLCLGTTPVEPRLLTLLINGAPELRHLEFAFVPSCNEIGKNPTPCQQGRLQANVQLLAALESRANLSSLGVNAIWEEKDEDCACMRFEAAFENMLRTIGPQLEHFALTSGYPPINLRVSDMFGIIRNRMPRLKSIKLFLIEYNLDPEDLRGIAERKELEELELTLPLFDDERMNDVLSKIRSKSLRLKRLVVTSLLPDQRVVEELCKLSELVELRTGASTLTKENFIAFSRAFAANLQGLSLDRIEEPAELGLVELIVKSNQLRILEIHDGNMTNRLLAAVAMSCPNVEKISARWGDSITIGVAQLLVDRCPKLQSLEYYDISGSDLIDLTHDRYRKPICSRL